jgi:hypothetical protein
LLPEAQSGLGLAGKKVTVIPEMLATPATPDHQRHILVNL